MNIGSLEAGIFGLALLSAGALIALHIVGDVRTIIRRYKDARPKNSSKRDRYRPTLTALVYHTAASADITRCLESLLANPYHIDAIMVIDTTDNREAQNITAKYRKKNVHTHFYYRSFSNTLAYRQQSGSIRSLLTSKLTLSIDSASLLDSSSLLPAVRTFRNTKVVSVLAQTGITPNNSLLQGLHATRQALINNFRRAFSSTSLCIKKGLHPALLIRTSTLRRIIDANEGVLPLTLAHYVNPELYNNSATLIRSVDLHVWVDDTNYRAKSPGFVFTVSVLLAVVILLIYQLGTYNAAPLLLTLWLLWVIFAALSQTATSSKYSRIDAISLSLLAPFSMLLPFFFLYKRARLAMR